MLRRDLSVNETVIEQLSFELINFSFPGSVIFVARKELFKVGLRRYLILFCEYSPVSTSLRFLNLFRAMCI